MIELWCDITRTGEVALAALSDGLTHSPVQYVVCTIEQIAQLMPIKLQGYSKIACLAVDTEQIDKAREFCDIIVVQDDELIAQVKKTGSQVAFRYVVKDGITLQICRQMIGKVDFLLSDFTDETNIPLELLIASAQGSGTCIVKYVQGEEEAVIAQSVLESGPAGLLLAIEQRAEISKLQALIKKMQLQKLPLVEATVTSVRHAGMGYRGCIDTTWLFQQDEGMIIGSTSSGGLLVCAEVHYLPYMNLRPFRVNAGSMHSYVWSSDTTEYLTDLEAGGTVLAVNTEGFAYPVTVGRVKIEKRPLRLIEVKAGEVTLNIFLQDDWHVRVFGADKQPKNCSTIKVGDTLLAYVCEPGRHVGIKVAESIEEH